MYSDGFIVHASWDSVKGLARQTSIMVHVCIKGENTISYTILEKNHGYFSDNQKACHDWQLSAILKVAHLVFSLLVPEEVYD